MVDGGEIKTIFSQRSVNYTGNGGETSFLSFPSLRNKITIHIATNLLLDPTIIRVRETINGLPNLLVSEFSYPGDFLTNLGAIRMVLNGAGESMDITFQSVNVPVVAIPINIREEIRQ